MEDIVVSEELKAYIDPITPEEHEALERSLLAEGCRDALVLWGNLLIDGHNRYGICQKHGLPFQTVQHPHFKSMEDVHLWMIDQHLGRRSVSDFQRGVLALRKREIVEARRQRRIAATGEAASPEAAAAGDAPWDGAATGAAGSPAADVPAAPVLKSRTDIAKAARLSANQVVLIEKIQAQAAPEVVAAVKSGAISLNAAAAVASLPVEEQVAAAQGGKDELKQAAKRARGPAKPKAEAKPAEAGAEGAEPSAEAAPAAPASVSDEVVQLMRQRIADLTVENQSLRDEVARLRLQLATEQP